MKKYVLLCILTLAAGISILIFGQAIKSSVRRADIVVLKPITVENSVMCSGKVESASDDKVYAPVSSVSKKVYVKIGDKVKAGEKLMDLSVPVSAASPAEGSSQFGNSYQAYAQYLNGTTSPPAASADTKTMTAPEDGTIEDMAVRDPGSFVDTQEPLFVIKKDGGVDVRLEVDESQIADIRVGQSVQITGVGFKNSVYSGKIQSISSEAKQKATLTGQETVVEAVVSVEKPREDIKPGFTAKARVVTSRDTHVLSVPYEAVKSDQQGNEYVFRLVGNRAVKTAIVTAREYDNGFEVKSGLSPSDQVIVGQDEIIDGDYVIPLTIKAVSALD